ncbi:hypothetical protein TanjilG_04494 [Lupinus angustifolius]|uniref:Oxidative stress 3 n=1 Tax=Lupinus angustifolius TaxID=3871 RepID=A0A4P1RQD5_LUPAN|nr:PREDICTED: uncharacterized protein LOC109342963 [Lupinus angustifolius]OIW15959.1 hypothetical protein TanjilG_04494 [Lupinus angustifolius]
MDKKEQHLFQEDGEGSNDSISIGSFSEDSMNSMCSSSDFTDLEETSSVSTSPSSHSNGPLYELSELMNHLPIKRGLSMFYQGKAQSFTSLAMVESVEDLPKKCTSHRERMKSCKSYGGGLNNSHIISLTPKAKISKKASRGSNFVSVLSKRGNFIGGSRLSFALNKNF